MSKVKVACFGLSIDGFSAGPRQSVDDPLGVGGKSLMEWFFPTRAFRQMHGIGDGETGVDEDFAARGLANIGARILGRNMFGPVRGPWPDESWKGWWGDNPPYHLPVFVLTRHARDSIEMQGGTALLSGPRRHAKHAKRLKFIGQALEGYVPSRLSNPRPVIRQNMAPCPSPYP